MFVLYENENIYTIEVKFIVKEQSNARMEIKIKADIKDT